MLKKGTRTLLASMMVLLLSFSVAIPAFAEAATLKKNTLKKSLGDLKPGESYYDEETGITIGRFDPNKPNKKSVKKINLEVGESYYDEETGITIGRLPDDYSMELRTESNNYIQYTDCPFYDDLNGIKDYKNIFTLTDDICWWKLEWCSKRDGNSLEVYSDDGYSYREYNFEKGSFFVYTDDFPGDYTVQFWNAHNGLYGWIGCRIADSKDGLSLPY